MGRIRESRPRYVRVWSPRRREYVERLNPEPMGFEQWWEEVEGMSLMDYNRMGKEERRMVYDEYWAWRQQLEEL